MANFTGGAGRDTYTGTGESDVILGMGGNDTLSGGDGYDYDIVAGGAGADTVTGGTGSFSWLASGDVDLDAVSDGNRATSLDIGSERDTLKGGAGTDILCIGYGDNADGGDSDDWVAISLMGAPKGVTYTLGSNGPIPGGGNIANVENFVWLQGSNFGDTLYGGSERGFNTVLGMGGNDKVYAGYYTNFVDGGDGDDTIYQDQAIYGPELRGGKGNDTIFGAGYNGSRTFGDEGDDTIYTSQYASGGDGKDHITISSGGFGAAQGDAGNDILENHNGGLAALIGGSGSDRLIGGSGAEELLTGVSDLYERGTAIDTGSEHDVVSAGGGDDVISAGIGDDVDGGEGSDTLRLSLAGASSGLKLSTAGLLGSAPIVFAGGTLGGIETIAYLGLSEFGDRIDVRASDVPQTLDLAGGNDVVATHGLGVIVLGGAGSDRLIGGNGGGVFDGGAGTDTAGFADARQGVTVQMLDSFDGGIIGNVARLFGVEIVNGSAFADTISGNNGDNVLNGLGGDDAIAGNGGNDILSGGAGINRLTGGEGNDTYILGEGTDTIVEARSGGDDTVKTSRSFTLTNHVENLVLTGAAAIDGTGTSLANVLTGNAGDNRLLGLGGSDVLVGGLGRDVLDGGAGGDVYVIASLDEQTGAEITDTGTTGRDELRIAVRSGLYTPYAGDTGIERYVIGTGTGAAADTSGTARVGIDASALGNRVELIGNSGVNALTGTAFADTLDGGAGIDTLIGGDGADRLFGGEGDDLLSGDAGQDKLDGGAGADILRGGLGDDQLAGGAGDDQLIGGEGHDRLDGGLGADSLAGGAGDDLYSIDDVGDTVTENAGEGRDTVVSLVNTALAPNLEDLTLIGSGALRGTGNTGDNTITGNGFDNVLAGGGGGKDTLIGGQGNDTYYADGPAVRVIETADGGNDRMIFTANGTIGANVEVGVAGGSGAVAITGNGANDIIGGNNAANVLDGGAGNDTLSGHGGADTLRGGAGDDFLFGGFDIDTLTGGAGSDQFAVGTFAPQGVDTITDFVSGVDTLLVVNPFVSGYLLAGGLAFGTSAKDDNDIAIYDRNSGNLWVDYDANGPGAKVLLAKLTPGTNLAASDLVLVDEGSFSQQIGGFEQLLLI